ncbi:uncharacterized protein LOC143609211 [Bidens hawaiensis]|uniref:uncharacterized protein LOC143609211 n=1 Tax=Bidens hawaiensis TaxID=980011 RepID=UPI00404AEABF
MPFGLCNFPAIEVDCAKIDTISRLPPPTNVKAIRGFLGHAGFYRRLIKDFSKITRPMTRLLEKDVPFAFDEECVKAFTFFKEKLVSAPVLCSPDWSLPFELICDASDYAGMTTQKKRKFFWDVNRYLWDDPFLFKIGGDRILRRCVTKEEGWDILKHVHEGLTGGHHGVHATTHKVFDSGFYWPTVVKDAEDHGESVSSLWGYSSYLYCLSPSNERSSREYKSRGEEDFRKTVGASRKDWSEKLDYALWAFRTTYKTPLGTTPFMFVYGKSCHIPVELEHRAYWALKMVNVELTAAARKRYFQIHELEELRDVAYSRSLNIEEKTKALHDRRKLRSKWTGPYFVKEVFPYGMVELENLDNGTSWKVNGHRLKHYLGGPKESTEMEEAPLDPSH